MPPDVWVTVNRDALRHNWSALRDYLSQESPPPQMIAVVKANAYGHGVMETARVLQDSGADFFAVTNPEEAIELRAAGITGRVLLFLPALPEQLQILIPQYIACTVCDEASVDAVAETANQMGRTARVHLKVDTGMGRLGVLPGKALAIAQRIVNSPSLMLDGVYTHFARALEQSVQPTMQQYTTFLQVLTQLQEAGISPGLRHCAGSAGILRDRRFWLDAVRPGTLLYGQNPAPALPCPMDLQSTWRMEARVVSVREVPSGTAVGYGGEFVTRRTTRLAVVGVGYADGFTVTPASLTSGSRGMKSLVRNKIQGGPQFSMTVRGKSAPVVGRVAMQTCSLDVTEIPGIVPGDIVTVPARRLTTSARIPRVYEGE